MAIANPMPGILRAITQRLSTQANLWRSGCLAQVPLASMHRCDPAEHPTHAQHKARLRLPTLLPGQRPARNEALPAESELEFPQIHMSAADRSSRSLRP